MNLVQINGAGVVVVIIDGVVAWNGWLKIVSYYIVALNFISKDGVAKRLSAAFRCLVIRLSGLNSLLFDQFFNVSPNFVGPYNGGGGFQVL